MTRSQDARGHRAPHRHAKGATNRDDFDYVRHDDFDRIYAELAHIYPRAQQPARTLGDEYPTLLAEASDPARLNPAWWRGCVQAARFYNC